MKVELQGSDHAQLVGRVAEERSAVQRDRYRAVLVAGVGIGGRELTREEIASVLGRSRQFVDHWVGRYRGLGLAGLVPRKPPGRKPKLTAAQQTSLAGLLDAGPTPESGRSAYFGRDIKRLIEERFGQVYHLNGVYALLDRMGYSHLVPRPRHCKDDPAARETFKKSQSKRSARWRRPTPTSVS